jgi:probable rRNA maturation factor
VIKNLEVNNDTQAIIGKLLISKIVKLLKEELDLNISFLQINFISATQITQINKNFLNHNYSTDIITFNYSNERKILDGEIYISIEDAETNAKKFGVTFVEEILRLVIHGILHLIGYDDVSSGLKIKMKKIENKLFSRIRDVILREKEPNAGRYS